MNRVHLAVLTAAASVALLPASMPPGPAYPLRPVPLANARVTGGFWQQKMETNRAVTIPHIMQQNEKTGRVDNLRKGAGLMTGDYLGRRFNDTDVYKVVEAASYSLVSHPDPALAKQVDDLIALIAKCQQPDGYVFPARTINPAKPAAGVGTERWQYENTGSHELYNAGHLFEAAVAHYQATGKRTLLDVAVKEADLVVKTFGATARRDAPGHEVVEMALVRLYQATADRRFLDEAKFFLDVRGTDHHASQDYTEKSWLLYNDRAYRQDDRPVVDQTTAHGHAVRAMYLYNAMTDIAAMLKDAAYGRAVDRLWQDVYSKRAYLTGGLGSVGGTEAFGADYQLPNANAYAETCASVGAVLWGHRMFLRTGEAKYLDALEQTLYNGLLSGVSVQGDTFFYQNPLESSGRAQRTAYMDVACCPANLSRLIAQLPGLIYATDGNALYVNLYVNSEADVTIKGAKVHVVQTTNYPWDGKVGFVITADRPVQFPLKLRVPQWVGPSVFGTDLYSFATPSTDPVNVTLADVTSSATAPGWCSPRADVVISKSGNALRSVRAGITLPMPVRRVLGNPGIKDDAGKAAIQRGPILFAIEGVDNGGKVLDLNVPLAAGFTPAYRADLLGGVETLAATISGQDGAPRQIVAIPYFAWANRGRGEMVVWIRQ